MTPHPRKSFTLKTLLIISRPRLSKTRTFHIGSPSEFNIGVVLGMRPFAVDESWWTELSSVVRLRLRIFSSEAILPFVSLKLALEYTCGRPTYLPVSKGLLRSHISSPTIGVLRSVALHPKQYHDDWRLAFATQNVYDSFQNRCTNWIPGIPTQT